MEAIGIMAYKKKYYKEIYSHGHSWRVEFWQDTDALVVPLIIGPVLQALRLVVQGDQADIDTPIVKTSLEMAFVDAPDYTDDSRVRYKTGDWEEFYTASATEWQVRLYKDDMIEWTGYVTPDSFAEDLRYRGSVSIIARDNLGHLQDYTFDMVGDADGMVCLWDLVQAAFGKVSCALTLGGGLAYSMQNISPRSDDSEGGLLASVLFNVSAFKDKNWLQALEDVLYSTGMVLRYEGGNAMGLRTIRTSHLCGYDFEGNVPEKDVTFVAYGRRELSPAVKMIEERADFDINEGVLPVTMPDTSYGEGGSIPFYPLEGGMYSIPVHAYDGGIFGKVNSNASRLINPFAYALHKDYSYEGLFGDLQSENTIYMALNSTASGVMTDRAVVFQSPAQFNTLRIRMTITPAVTLYDNSTRIGYVHGNAAYYVLGSIRWIGEDGNSWHLSQIDQQLYHSKNLKWVQSEGLEVVALGSNSVNGDFVLELPDLDVNGKGRIEIKFYGGRLIVWDVPDNLHMTGAYGGLKDISIQEAGDIPSSMKVLRITTKYDDKNNIKLNRTPQFAFNPSGRTIPANIKNGIFVRNSMGELIGSESWYWHDNDDRRPLTALIHQQILCYYSKPNSVLTGELIGADGRALSLDSLYVWRGVRHQLMAGALNILTGRIEGAVLREFKRYDEMWETHVDKDDISVDAGTHSVTIHYKARNGETDLTPQGLPTWIEYERDDEEITLIIEENYSRDGREVYIKIDTAIVRVRQQGKRAYNYDYNEDYS